MLSKDFELTQFPSELIDSLNQIDLKYDIAIRKNINTIKFNKLSKVCHAKLLRQI
jgi:hypothetical protein